MNLQALPKKQSFGRGNSTKSIVHTKEKVTSDSIGTKLTDKELLDVSIRVIEQMMYSQGQYMTRAQIFDLIRKTAVKSLYNM